MYRVIVDKNVIKKAKKYLKPAQRRKLAEFLETLKTNPYPKPPYDLKPVKGSKTKETSTYLFLLKASPFRAGRRSAT